MLGFIGAGNMASAIIKGLISSGTYSGGEIAVFDLCEEKLEVLCRDFSVRAFHSEKEIASGCDVVVLAVKPNVLPSVLEKIKTELKTKDPLIISIAAGKTLEFIASHLDYEAKLARVMPNINATVLAAVSAFCLNGRAKDGYSECVKAFCESFGIATQLDEKLFSVYTAIGGCSPAFAYMFIDSLARAAVKNGMPKDKALEVAAGAVLGSAKMILESDEHPWSLVDKVCSPGGTTIEGVAALQENGFEAAVTKAVEAAFNKDKKV